MVCFSFRLIAFRPRALRGEAKYLAYVIIIHINVI